MNGPRRQLKSSERGTALLAALCFATVLSIALGSYMTVCYRTLELSTRTMQSTHSVELAETGMEDALWALNNNDWSTWSITGTTATKTLSGFSYDGGVTGDITLTIASYNGSAGTRTVSAVGTTHTPNLSDISRTLTSSSVKAPLFVNAVAGTTGTVRFTSAGTVDSYSSTVGDYTAQTPGYSAILSSGATSTSASTVQLGNAQVKGYVATLSTGPSYSTSALLVGPTTSSSTKIDTNRESTSPYQPIFDITTPAGTATVLSNGSSHIGTSGAASSGLYSATDLSLNGGQTLTVDGPVIITVSGNLSITQNGKIQVTSTGSVELHVTGTITINGNGIQNDTKIPKNMILVSSTAPDTAAMATTTAFYGVIYIPNSSFTVSSSQAIYGSIVAKSVTFSASPAIHYDIALRDAVLPGIVTPYAVSNWRESTNGG